MRDLPTASGAITIRTADGTPVGHGWGEVRIRRDPRTGGSSAISSPACNRVSGLEYS